MEKSGLHIAAEAEHRFPLPEAAHAADIDLPVLQQWIQREHVCITSKAIVGVARKVTGLEILRLAAIPEIVFVRDVKIAEASTLAAHITNQHWDGFRDDGPWFLAIYSDMVRPKEGDAFIPHRDDHIAEVVQQDGIAALLARPEVRRLSIIPLRELEYRVSERLQDIYELEARRQSRERHG